MFTFLSIVSVCSLFLQRFTVTNLPWQSAVADIPAILFVSSTLNSIKYFDPHWSCFQIAFNQLKPWLGIANVSEKNCIKDLLYREKSYFAVFSAFRQQPDHRTVQYMMCTLLQNKILSVRCSLAGGRKPSFSLVHWKISGLSLAHVGYQLVNCRWNLLTDLLSWLVHDSSYISLACGLSSG